MNPNLRQLLKDYNSVVDKIDVQRYDTTRLCAYLNVDRHLNFDSTFKETRIKEFYIRGMIDANDPLVGETDKLYVKGCAEARETPHDFTYRDLFCWVWVRVPRKQDPFLNEYRVNTKELKQFNEIERETNKINGITKLFESKGDEFPEDLESLRNEVASELINILLRALGIKGLQGQDEDGTPLVFTPGGARIDPLEIIRKVQANQGAENDHNDDDEEEQEATGVDAVGEMADRTDKMDLDEKTPGEATVTAEKMKLNDEILQIVAMFAKDAAAPAEDTALGSLTKSLDDLQLSWRQPRKHRDPNVKRSGKLRTRFVGSVAQMATDTSVTVEQKVARILGNDNSKFE